MLSKPYSKIETLFERDAKTFKVIEGVYKRPEFSFIDPWLITEKIDGTNIRLHFWNDQNDSRLEEEIEYEIGGRTNNAQIPARLFTVLKETADKIRGGVGNLMSAYDLKTLTIYGEGYGSSIQKGGGNYAPEPRFAAFDMLIDNIAWLSQGQVQQNCFELGLEMVPIIGRMTREAVVGIVANDHFYSSYGDFPAEGVVARPPAELRDFRNKRVCWKLKHKDF